MPSGMSCNHPGHNLFLFVHGGCLSVVFCSHLKKIHFSNYQKLSTKAGKDYILKTQPALSFLYFTALCDALVTDRLSI
jgi:hypothetical protein